MSLREVDRFGFVEAAKDQKSDRQGLLFTIQSLLRMMIKQQSPGVAA